MIVVIGLKVLMCGTCGRAHRCSPVSDAVWRCLALLCVRARRAGTAPPEPSPDLGQIIARQGRAKPPIVVQYAVWFGCAKESSECNEFRMIFAPCLPLNACLMR